MPKTGTSLSNRPASSVGAPGSYTLEGPPERMIAAGFFASISATGIECGTISE
jgi:membrane carboxypeptidase/penicillin-binding protein PbpC